MKIRRWAALRTGPAEVARRLGVSVKALKIYERVGLLRPTRTPRGWRTYSEDDIERLSRALSLKAMGFSLSQIAGLLDAGPEEYSAALAAQELYMLRRRAEVDAVLSELRKAQSSRSSFLRLAA